MSLFPSSSTRLVRDLLLSAPVLSHLVSDKVRTSLRQRRISLGLNRHQVQGFGSSPAKGVISRPWQSSLPQKTVGTTPCPRFRITDPLALPFGGQPQCGSRRGRTSDHSTTELSMFLRDGTAAESNLVVLSQPQVELTVPPNRKTFFRQRHDCRQTVLRRASHNNKPGKAYAPPP